MDKETKEILYKQIEEMSANNLNGKSCISKQEYMELPLKDALKYIFDYRNSSDFGIDEEDGSKITFYIELPDINLAGEDLTELRISEFIPGIIGENNKIIPSFLNFENTNALIDINDMGYTRSEENDRGITDYIIDFEKMNFNGCSIYGILPDEYAEYQTNPQKMSRSQYKTENKEGHLDEKYLQRRKENHLSIEKKIITDNAYQKILNGNSLKGMRGINDGKINFIDYDFNKLDEDKFENLLNDVTKYEININWDMLVHEQKEMSDLYFKKLKDRFYKKSVLENEYKSGNIRFVEEYWKEISKEDRINIVKRAYDKGDIQFVQNHLELLDTSIKMQVLSQAYDEGNKKILEKYWHSIDETDKSELLKKAYKKGDEEFVKEHLKDLESYNKAEIVRQAFADGNVKFVRTYWGNLDKGSKSNIVEYAFANGNIEFVKLHWNGIDDYSKYKIMIKALNNKDTEFIKVQWKEIGDDNKSRIVVNAFENDNMEFVESYWNEIDNSSKFNLIQRAFNNKNMGFIESHFNKVDNDTRYKIACKALKVGNKEFVDSHWNDIEDKNYFLEFADYYGYSQFVRDRYEFVTDAEFKKKLMSGAVSAGDVGFIEKHLEDKLLPEDYIVSKLLVNKNVTSLGNIINKYIETEKNMTVTMGAYVKSASGKLLYEVLENKDVDVNKVLEIIKAGPDLDYVSYSSKKISENQRQVTFTPVLMRALEINDKERKEKIVNALVDAGVNTSAKTKISTYSGKEQKANFILAKNDEYLKQILKQRKSKDNDKSIQSFLQKEMQLSEEEISNLENTFQEYGQSIYKSSYDKLKMQKEILSSVGCEKVGFTKFSKVLFLDSKVMYARLKFFDENKIEVNPDELHKTLAATNKKFANEYGEKIIHTTEKGETYVQDVKKELLQKYKMPFKKEQLMFELKQIKENNREKEID